MTGLDARRTDARLLDTAEGVLIALRRCGVTEAFDEILATAQQHHVPALGLARALVDLACDQPAPAGDKFADAARAAWGDLFERQPAPAAV